MRVSLLPSLTDPVCRRTLSRRCTELNASMAGACRRQRRWWPDGGYAVRIAQGPSCHRESRALTATAPTCGSKAISMSACGWWISSTRPCVIAALSTRGRCVVPRNRCGRTR